MLSDDDDGSGEGNNGENDLPDNSKQADTKDKVQPPIIVPHKKHAVVENVLTDADCDHMLRLQKDRVTIKPFTRQSYEKVFCALKAADIKYYTYGTPDKVPVKIVLSGYPSGTIPELLDDLAEEHEIKPREAKMLSKKVTAIGECVLYLLYFDRGSVKIQDLRRIKSMDQVYGRPTLHNATDASGLDTVPGTVLCRQSASNVEEHT